MKDMVRRIARLESECAHRGAGADADAQAAAHAKLMEFLHAICAEKAAGDVRGIAGRQLAGLLAELERRA